MMSPNLLASKTKLEATSAPYTCTKPTKVALMKCVKNTIDTPLDTQPNCNGMKASQMLCLEEDNDDESTVMTMSVKNKPNAFLMAKSNMNLSKSSDSKTWG